MLAGLQTGPQGAGQPLPGPKVIPVQQPKLDTPRRSSSDIVRASTDLSP